MYRPNPPLRNQVPWQAGQTRTGPSIAPLRGFFSLEIPGSDNVDSRVMEHKSHDDVNDKHNIWRLRFWSAKFGGRAAKSALSELNGIVKFWLWHRGIQYALVAPSTLKKFILGAGKGEKSFIVREVFRAYGLEATTDDEADACVLAHIGLCLIGREEPRNKAQREVLVTLTAEKQKNSRKKKLQEAA